MRQEFKGTIRWLGGGLYGPNGPVFPMFSFLKTIHPITQHWRNELPRAFSTWTPLCELGCDFFALVVGLCFIFGSVGVVVGQNVVWWWRNFSIFGEYAFIFHRFGERARPPSPSETIKWKYSGSVGTRIHRALMLTCDSFLNSFITLPKSPWFKSKVVHFHTSQRHPVPTLSEITTGI